MNNLIKDIPKTSQLEKKLLQARIKELESLPLPSCTMLELSTILKTDPGNQVAMANCFAHDHVMLAQMLRVFYHTYPGVNPTSPLDAVAMLPIDRIQSLIYIPHILPTFGEREEQEWNHAYTCRILMESILDDNGIDNPELIRAAHLHDIGKNVFRDWSPKKYKLVEKHAESSHEVPLYKLENAVLQIDHAEAGAELLKAWGFNEAVWQIVAQHHNHDDDPPETYVFETALLQFVNYIDCKVRGIPCEPPSTKLMKKARIAEIDEEGYLGSQKALIERLRANDNEAIRRSVVTRMLEVEKQAQAEAAAEAELAAQKLAEEIQEEMTVETEEVVEETTETVDEIAETPEVQAEPAPLEPVKVEPVKVEPVKVEPVKVEPVKVEPVKVEPVKVEPVKVEPVKEEPATDEQKRGIAFSPRFRSASLSISAGNGFTPAAAPTGAENNVAAALNEEDNILENPAYDPANYDTPPQTDPEKQDSPEAPKDEFLLKDLLDINDR